MISHHIYNATLDFTGSPRSSDRSGGTVEHERGEDAVRSRSGHAAFRLTFSLQAVTLNLLGQRDMPTSVPTPKYPSFLADFKPKYQQLATYILKNIQEGTWPVGTLIPSEMHLVEQFSLSRNTVREAIKQLELSGYIYRIHGKGSYVSTARLNQRFNNLTSFSRDILAAGMTPGHRNLEIRKVTANEAISMKLQVPLNSECLFLHRLLLADDLVFIVVRTYFSMQWLEMSGITITDDSLSGGSLYEFFSTNYGISFTKASIIARAVRATNEESRYLGIPKGSPILATERLAYTADNIPRELTFGAGHPDRHQWSMTVYKDVDASGSRGAK